MGHRNRLILMALFVASCCGTLPAFGGVITITPSKDNTLYQSGDGSLSDGAGPHFFVGETGGGLSRRGLLAFDIAAAVPAGAAITNVSLALNLSKAASNSASRNITLHTLTQNWGEGSSDSGDPGGRGAPSTPGDATWLHTFFDTQLWANPGGDFSSTVSATFTPAGTAPYNVSGSQLTTDVQNWFADPSTNFGWILIGDESTSNTADRFDSRENGDTTAQPALTITYTAAPEPASLAIAAALAPLLMRRRRVSVAI